MNFIHSMLRDGHDGSWSSRRIVTFAAFVFCSIAFFANLFFEKKIDANIFDGMMFIAIAGLGATVTEKFASRTTYQQQTYPQPITTKRIYGTPLPKVEEKEI